MNTFRRSILSTLSAATLLAGCGMETSNETKKIYVAPDRSGDSFLGVTQHTDPVPTITGYKAGFVEIDGKPRTVYVLKCAGVDGVVSVDGIGAIQCGLGEAVANTVELRV